MIGDYKEIVYMEEVDVEEKRKNLLKHYEYKSSLGWLDKDFRWLDDEAKERDNLEGKPKYEVYLEGEGFRRMIALTTKEEDASELVKRLNEGTDWIQAVLTSFTPDELERCYPELAEELVG